LVTKELFLQGLEGIVDTTTQATPAAAQAPITDGMHVLAAALKVNGVKNIYGVCGIPITALTRICQGEGMRYVGMRHEQDAGNAAAAEGFLTGRPGIYMTVSAPGYMNGLPALKEATENCWPVVMISGSSSRSLVDMGEGDYEGVDQLNYAKPFAKAAYRIDRVEDIMLGVARAFRTAMSGRPGGVYLDIPADMLGQTMDMATAKAGLYAVGDAPKLPPAQESVDEALKLLAGAKNPLILVGKGAAYAQAEDELNAFVEATHIPFLPMSMAKGLIPDNSPYSAASARGLSLRTADVILLVGARLNWMLSFGVGKHYNPNVKFIQLEIDPTEIDNSRQIACPVIGDLKLALQMMNKGLATTPVTCPDAWLQELAVDIKKNNAKFDAVVNTPVEPMNHQCALGAVKRVYDKNQDTILVNEGANTLDDCRNIVDMYLPRHRLDCGTWGVMGIGTGYAIAAAVTTGKSVISIHGDSAFGFDGMEIETACRYNLPIVFMVFNNGGVYRGDFENIGTNGDPSPLTLDINAHYEKMIEAFGGDGYYATTVDDVETMLTKALASKKTSLIHVQLSPHAGEESGHIGYLNPEPVFGPLTGGAECEDLTFTAPTGVEAN
jgi:oxalyl-CoA decarboxylase